MKNTVYNILKWLCTIGLHAMAALYVGLAQQWGAEVFPYAEQIAGTLALIGAFIGAVIGISSKQYWNEHEIVPKGAEDENGE